MANNLIHTFSANSMSLTSLILHLLSKIFVIFFRITLVSSIFLIVGTAVERYLAVCRPHHYHQVHLIWIYPVYCVGVSCFRSRTDLIGHWPTSCPVLPQLSLSISPGEQNLVLTNQTINVIHWMSKCFLISQNAIRNLNSVKTVGDLYLHSTKGLNKI